MEKDISETKDISLAAYLYATDQGVLSGRRKLQNGDTIFQFSPADKVGKLISSYWNLTAPPIQPKRLFNCLRDIKDMIFKE